MFKKDPAFYSAYVIEGSFFNIHETKNVKPVKDLYAAYFSRSAIQNLEGSIQEKVNKFVTILQKAAALSSPVDLTLAYKCLTADVIMSYCFDKDFRALDAPKFRSKPLEDMEGLFSTATFVWYWPKLFNYLCRCLAKVPPSILAQIAPPLAATFEIGKVI